MVLDTGSNLSIIKPNANKSFYPCDKSHENDFKNCRINRFVLLPGQQPEDFYVQNLNLPFDGIIGSDYIQNHKIFIDSHKKIIYFC
jgi:hypothetical protein